LLWYLDSARVLRLFRGDVVFYGRYLTEEIIEGFVMVDVAAKDTRRFLVKVKLGREVLMMVVVFKLRYLTIESVKGFVMADVAAKDSRRFLKEGKLRSKVLKVDIDVLAYKGLGQGQWFLEVVDFIITGKISKRLIEPIAEAPPDRQ